jgi:hypothetical protein
MMTGEEEEVMIDELSITPTPNMQYRAKLDRLGGMTLGELLHIRFPERLIKRPMVFSLTMDLVPLLTSWLLIQAQVTWLTRSEDWRSGIRGT